MKLKKVDKATIKCPHQESGVCNDCANKMKELVKKLGGKKGFVNLLDKTK